MGCKWFSFRQTLDLDTDDGDKLWSVSQCRVWVLDLTFHPIRYQWKSVSKRVKKAYARNTPQLTCRWNTSLHVSCFTDDIKQKLYWTHIFVLVYYIVNPTWSIWWFWRASNFQCLKLIEIVILWVYYTIPFGFSLIWHFLVITFQLFRLHVWLRITDEGSIPEMRIWSIS